MQNEEMTREALETTKNGLKKVVKALVPITRFAVNHWGKPTAEMLIADMKAALKIHPEHGEMSVKDLIRKDQGAQAVDIDAMGLRDFRRLANKFGVDFAIVKTKSDDKTKYSVFFKARDADAISAVINEYTARQLKIEEFGRPSVLAKLEAFKKIAAELSKKEVEKMKEAVR